MRVLTECKVAAVVMKKPYVFEEILGTLQLKKEPKTIQDGITTQPPSETSDSGGTHPLKKKQLYG